MCMRMCMCMVRSMCMCMCMVRSPPGVCILLMLVCTCFFFACLFWCVSAVLMSVFFCAGAGVLLFWCWCVHATGVYISAVLVIVCFCADTCMLRRYTHTHSCAISFCAVCVCALTDPPLTHSLTHSLPSLCVMRDFFLRGVWCLACVCVCVCVWCVACACVCVWCVAHQVCASYLCWCAHVFFLRVCSGV